MKFIVSFKWKNALNHSEAPYNFVTKLVQFIAAQELTIRKSQDTSRGVQDSFSDSFSTVIAFQEGFFFFYAIVKAEQEFTWYFVAKKEKEEKW